MFFKSILSGKRQNFINVKILDNCGFGTENIDHRLNVVIVKC